MKIERTARVELEVYTVPGKFFISFSVLHAFSALVSMMHKDVILIPKDEGL